MNATMRVLGLSVCLLGLTHCTSMRLEELDGDLPSALVDDAESAGVDYVDRGFFWFPLVLSQSGQLARTRFGFVADRTTSLGPLGLPVARSEDAGYDEDGRLVVYRSATNYLWGFLAQNGNRHAGSPLEDSVSWFKICFGLLGYSTEANGASTLYFLFIPIPMASGSQEPTVSGA